MVVKRRERPVISPLGQVLTTEQIAEMLQISQRTVQRAIREGHLRAHRVGRIYRVNAEDLRVWWDALRTGELQQNSQ
jgi:excisionase family DNA binding protein